MINDTVYRKKCLNTKWTITATSNSYIWFTIKNCNLKFQLVLHSLILLSELTIWETESPGFISTKSRTLICFNFPGLFRHKYFTFQIPGYYRSVWTSLSLCSSHNYRACK